MAELIAVYSIGNEQINVWQYGHNDYAVYFRQADCNLRGTLKDVWEFISGAYDLEDLEEVEL